MLSLAAKVAALYAQNIWQKISVIESARSQETNSRALNVRCGFIIMRTWAIFLREMDVGAGAVS